MVTIEVDTYGFIAGVTDAALNPLMQRDGYPRRFGPSWDRCRPSLVRQTTVKAATCEHPFCARQLATRRWRVSSTTPLGVEPWKGAYQ